MPFTRHKWVLAAALVFGCFFARPATAVVVDGRSSTQLIWYNDIVDASKQMEAAELLRVSISGIDGADKLSIRGYGKLNYDLKHGGEVEDRLYYLYADYKGLFDTADVKLGRQFVNLSAGSALIDGIEADINKIGPVAVVLMGGRNVLFGEDGELSSHLSTYGAQVYWMGEKMAYLDVSYFRAYDYSNVARDLVASSYKQYFFDVIKAYANAKYDLTSEVFNELLGGLKYFPMLNLMLTAEHYESYPTFDTTSIYSVFAVDKFKEDIARADYTLAAWIDISLAYSHESFGEGGRAKLYEAGLRLRPSLNSTIGLFHDKRWGYPGDLSGYKVYAEYGNPGKWKAAAGVDYDAYTRDDMTGQETARKYWAGGRYFFTKKMSSTLRIEDNVNVNYSKDVQGRASFDVDF
ncbi:MAG TPA: hypothetical protein VIX18_12345 [Nitrospirota bacterium]